MLSQFRSLEGGGGWMEDIVVSWYVVVCLLPETKGDEFGWVGVARGFGTCWFGEVGLGMGRVGGEREIERRGNGG